MRSYQSHVTTLLDPVTPKTAKGVFRSSAIFPVIHDPHIQSRILFLGYWMLKRDISSVGLVITLRSKEGKVLNRSHLQIDEARCYRVELFDELQKIGWSASEAFEGSLELEFFSSVNLVFPYPAAVLNYYGKTFSTVVHTAQRVYNDYEDMKNNSESHVAEAGFNIYADDAHEPFVSIVNGPESVRDGVIRTTLYNSDGENFEHVLALGSLHPYQTTTVYPARQINLKGFLKGKVGTAKVNFDVSWIYPRIIAGNMQYDNHSASITHTYYDCANAHQASDYWKPADPQWYDAALFVPLTLSEGRFTKAYFYPIYSPSTFTVDVELYDHSGTRLCAHENWLTISSPDSKFTHIDFNEVCRVCGIDPTANMAARIIARRVGDSFPTRIKLGLDIGVSGNHLPCNICTNLHPFNPSVDSKPHTFRWAPLLADTTNASFWILNSSPKVNYTQSAEVQLTFFREVDTSTLTRTLSLSPHGFAVISSKDDLELATFLVKSIGWCTAKANNPYVTTYYFAQHPSGAIGGDHGF